MQNLGEASFQALRERVTKALRRCERALRPIQAVWKELSAYFGKWPLYDNGLEIHKLLLGSCQLSWHTHTPARKHHCWHVSHKCVNKKAVAQKRIFFEFKGISKGWFVVAPRLPWARQESSMSILLLLDMFVSFISLRIKISFISKNSLYNIDWFIYIF